MGVVQVIERVGVHVTLSMLQMYMSEGRVLLHSWL